MELVTAVHLVATLVAAGTLLSLWWSGRKASQSAYLTWAVAGTVVWAASVTSDVHEGLHPWHQILWLPSIAFTTGAMALWAGQFARYDWRPTIWQRTIWVAVPTAVLALRIALGTEIRAALWAVNTVYCFTLLVLTALLVARRANDHDPAVRALVRFLLGLAAFLLILESFRANLSDIAVAGGLAVVAAYRIRRPLSLQPRPDQDHLLDDLGALVFVFDENEQLVDLNAPAKLFYSMRGAAPPEPGSAAADIVGAPLSGTDTLAVTLSAGGSDTRFTGYAQRMPASGSPPSGWICLLRRSVRDVPPEERRQARRALMGRLPGHDPATGLLSETGFMEVLAGAASSSGAEDVNATALVAEAGDRHSLERAAALFATAWNGHLDTVALGRSGPTSVAVVLRGVDARAARSALGQGRGTAGLRLATSTGRISESPRLVEDAVASLRSGRGPE